MDTETLQYDGCGNTSINGHDKKGGLSIEGVQWGTVLVETFIDCLKTSSQGWGIINLLFSGRELLNDLVVIWGVPVVEE